MIHPGSIQSLSEEYFRGCQHKIRCLCLQSGELLLSTHLMGPVHSHHFNYRKCSSRLICKTNVSDHRRWWLMHLFSIFSKRIVCTEVYFTCLCQQNFTCKVNFCLQNPSAEENSVIPSKAPEQVLMELVARLFSVLQLSYPEHCEKYFIKESTSVCKCENF